jgi:hypothetical protein
MVKKVEEKKATEQPKEQKDTKHMSDKEYFAYFKIPFIMGSGQTPAPALTELSSFGLRP